MQQKFYILESDNFEEIKNKLNNLNNIDVLYYPLKNNRDQIRELVQLKDIAFLTNDEKYAYQANVDGLIIPFQKIVKSIKKQLKDKALGVFCQNRDEAMHAGEDGADFIIFYGEHSNELISWWVELFTIPCLSIDSENGLADFCVLRL